MPANAATDPMAQLVEIIAKASAREINRKTQNNAASGVATTKDGDVPIHSPGIGENHGTNS